MRVERSATISATLRSQVVAGSVQIASAVTADSRSQNAANQAAILAGFAQAISSEPAPSAKALLRSALQQWLAIVAAAGPSGHPTTLAIRGAAVATKAPQVLALLDRAGDSSRAAARQELSDATRTGGEAMLGLTILELLTVLLAARLSRRLSREILRPLGVLRDSANHLAAGDLDHRVTIGRSDEIGDLATSFNAMAEAIASSQRTLTLEANTDSLSGLANRAAFQARLEATLSRSDQRASTQAVLFVDLDDFKDVNDSLGHAAGDDLLRVVATRLTDSVRPGDLVARLGGDEFAVLLDGLSDLDMALVIARRIVTELAEPVQIGDSWAHVGASVGLAMRREHSSFGTLMSQADIAMYTAKGKGKNRVDTYDPRLGDLAMARQVLRSELAVAAANSEFVLEYQPIVDLASGRLAGLEALVRWQHPTQGLLPPAAFIAIAEESGAINNIGAFVLETAVRQLHQWQRRYARPELWMSVNVSVRELNQPGYADTVAAALDVARLHPDSLVVEVTETVLADPGAGAAEALAALRLTGVRVALDDFGTGFSSIGYLRQFPVDIIKIDRTFVTDDGAPGIALLEAIVAMARRLELVVIAEGIEQPDQMSRLRAMGCNIGQGFLLYRPAPAALVEGFLATPKPLPQTEPASGSGPRYHALSQRHG